VDIANVSNRLFNGVIYEMSKLNTSKSANQVHTEKVCGARIRTELYKILESKVNLQEHSKSMYCFLHLLTSYTSRNLAGDDEFPTTIADYTYFQKHPRHYTSVLQHTLMCLDALGNVSVSERLAVLFHDIGKKSMAVYNIEEGKDTYHGHQDISKEKAARIFKELGVSINDAKKALFLIETHHDLLNPTKAHIRRLVSRHGHYMVNCMFRIRYSDLGGQYYAINSDNVCNLNELVVLRDAEAFKNEYVAQLDLMGKFPIKGDVLVKIGLVGPAIGTALEELKEYAATMDIWEEAKLLAYLKNSIVPRMKGEKWELVF